MTSDFVGPVAFQIDPNTKGIRSGKFQGKLEFVILSLMKIDEGRGDMVRYLIALGLGSGRGGCEVSTSVNVSSPSSFNQKRIRPQ